MFVNYWHTRVMAPFLTPNWILLLNVIRLKQKLQLFLILGSTLKPLLGLIFTPEFKFITAKMVWPHRFYTQVFSKGNWKEGGIHAWHHL